MAAATDTDLEEPVKKSKLPLILGVVLALAGGGGGFYAVSSGLLLGGESKAGEDSAKADHTDKDDGHSDDTAKPEIAFVPIEPLVVSLAGTDGTRFLRFAAQLEVAPGYESDVTAVMPRIVDVLNGYLRAVDLEELSDPDVLMRLRGQMLRRIQVVTGQKQVRDLLIMEFVLN